jgi:hypothetical protein
MEAVFSHGIRARLAEVFFIVTRGETLDVAVLVRVGEYGDRSARLNMLESGVILLSLLEFELLVGFKPTGTRDK